MNNEPIDTTLHVIAVISNPCQFARRYILAREFMVRMERERNIKLYFVELAYGDQEFHVTDKKNKRHLQLRGSIPLWHKENMINIGVKKLLPPTWKAFAWIDADIEFENTTWALDTLKVLNGYKDIVQPFSHCVDMNKNMTAIGIYPSFGFQLTKKQPYGGIQSNMWHPGYAWAATRDAINTMGGLFELGIVGAGDHHMACCLIGEGKRSIPAGVTAEYKKQVLHWEQRVSRLHHNIGFVRGTIYHFWHGKKRDRAYKSRWEILKENAYDPVKHVHKDWQGLLTLYPGHEKLRNDLRDYFQSRNEDSIDL